MDELRIATIGTSGICARFCDALAAYGGASLAGSYSRDIERARSFGAPRGARLFFDDLDALAGSAGVDAVYIASPNALHAAQALRLISGGKHVLVEKSFASNEREAREVFDAARSAGVVALEATRNLHTPSFGAIERIVSEGLGPVRLASLRFSKVSSRMPRLLAGERVNIFDPALSAGALMDIGVYCVEPAIALFGRPDEVRALSVTAPVPGCPEGDPCSTIDLAGEVVLGYADKVVSLSYGKASDGMLPSQVEGERGTLVWEPTSGPERLWLHECAASGQVFRVEQAEMAPVEVEVPENDMVCELADFVAAARGDAAALAARERFERVTLESLAVMDEVRRQVGVRFPADLS